MVVVARRAFLMTDCLLSLAIHQIFQYQYRSKFRVPNRWRMSRQLRLCNHFLRKYPTIEFILQNHLSYWLLEYTQVHTSHSEQIHLLNDHILRMLFELFQTGYCPAFLLDTPIEFPFRRFPDYNSGQPLAERNHTHFHDMLIAWLRLTVYHWSICLCKVSTLQP